MNTTRLQGIGLVRGKPAGELQVGDKILWNYGYSSIVEAITKVTPKTVTVLMSSGYERKFSKNRIVAA